MPGEYKHSLHDLKVGHITKKLLKWQVEHPI